MTAVGTPFRFSAIHFSSHHHGLFRRLPPSPRHPPFRTSSSVTRSDAGHTCSTCSAPARGVTCCCVCIQYFQFFRLSPLEDVEIDRGHTGIPFYTLPSCILCTDRYLVRLLFPLFIAFHFLTWHFRNFQPGVSLNACSRSPPCVCAAAELVSLPSA